MFDTNVHYILKQSFKAQGFIPLSLKQMKTFLWVLKTFESDSEDTAVWNKAISKLY